MMSKECWSEYSYDVFIHANNFLMSEHKYPESELWKSKVQNHPSAASLRNLENYISNPENDPGWIWLIGAGFVLKTAF